MQNVRRIGAWSLAAHTFAHFCVDFACFYQLFAGLARTSDRLETTAVGFMAYNAIAFGLQPIIGYWCDRKRTQPIALAGCLLLIGGLLLLPLGGLTLLPLSWLSLLICAVGNACFHVGGGSESLLNANGRMARSGIFVSSGALGVALGTLLGKVAAPADRMAAVLPIALLALAAVALATVNPRPALPLGSQTIPWEFVSPQYPFAAIMLLCLVSITIRSYAGSIVPMAWRVSTVLMILPAMGAMAGKAAGGFLADWLGARRTGVLSLLASLTFLVLGNRNPVLCVTGIALFNVSMSITLCAVYTLLPGFPGLSFGLTTLALLVGNLPTFFLAIPQSVNPFLMGILILASAGCLQLAIANQPRRTCDDSKGFGRRLPKIGLKEKNHEPSIQTHITDAL